MTRWKVSAAWPGHDLSIIELGCGQFSLKSGLQASLCQQCTLHVTCVYYILEAID